MHIALKENLLPNSNGLMNIWKTLQRRPVHLLMLLVTAIDIIWRGFGMIWEGK